MNNSSALALRDAVDSVQRHTPQNCVIAGTALPGDRIASDFATRFAGIPANSVPRLEKVVSRHVCTVYSARAT
jgi:hypothetical protein